MEGAEIGGLMVSICLFGAVLYSRTSPLRRLALSTGMNSALMGTATALTTFLIIRSPFGRRSGAHFNPAVTLSFLLLGRICLWDAICYIAAHFVGAVVGVLIARQLIGTRLAEPSVQYLVTIPGSHGEGVAFLVELALAGVLMAIVLYSSNHRGLSRMTPIFVATLTVVYFVACPSISGFGVNPARTFASALFAWIWQGIWIYITAPCLGMLMAAGIYQAAMGAESVYCAKVFHDLRSSCPFPCRFDQMEDTWHVSSSDSASCE
jgi:aquaporin Z